VTNGACGSTGTVGNLLHSFAASGNGTFSANPEPRYLLGAPEPTEAFLSGAVLLLLALKFRRGARVSA
jgi:hypothetical protein